MLLPLAWLVRVNDSLEHRQWLMYMARELLSYQDETGALREQIGEIGMGATRPPQSNAEFPRSEAPLIQNNGEPTADLLYTCNFALVGLTEAAAATADQSLIQAGKKLADFLVRIQMRSTSHPEFDGAWYRAFNFNLWEPWASNADYEWGPWCTETGWIQGWITATLALRHMHTCLWDLSADISIDRHFSHYSSIMLD